MEEEHQKIVDHWTNQTDWYSSKMLKMTASVFLSYVHLLELETAEKVLEVGCGTGNAIPHILAHANKTTEITASDLTPSMLEIARNNQYERTTFVEANNEQLPFADQEFDRYIANLSLMLVATPENMLREAVRVLKPGGIAAFSVWGSVEECNIITMPRKALADLGMPIDTNQRSNFHLNDIDRLRSMILEAGFSKCMSFQNVYPYNAFEPEQIVSALSGHPSMTNMDDETRGKVLDKIKENSASILSSGKFLTFSAIVVVAIK